MTVPAGMTTDGIPLEAHRRQPWKNGLGTSFVIAESPQGAGFDALDWQVSATAIDADCPFSDLPGLDRVFAVLEGGEVELACTLPGGEVRTLRAVAGGPSIAFRGDWSTHCRLPRGPVRVLNAIVRRGRFRAGIAAAPPGDRAPARRTTIAVDPASLAAWRFDGEVASIPRPGLAWATIDVSTHP